jgi:hypothetical protein
LDLPWAPTPLSERGERLRKLLGDWELRYILHVGGNQWYKSTPRSKRPGLPRRNSFSPANPSVLKCWTFCTGIRRSPGT